MIFDIYYDKTLWAMASGYKGEDIIKFIENIPEELIEKIKNILWLYRCYLVGNIEFDDIFSDEKSKLNDSVKTSGDMLYFYSLDLDAGSLDIGEAIVDGEIIYDTFQITLYPFRRKDYINIDNFSDYFLGDASFNYVEDVRDDDFKLYDFDFMRFNLFKLPFGITILCSGEYASHYKDGKVERNRYSLVNIRKIPNNYNVSDLRNKLVRSRKINNGSK